MNKSNKRRLSDLPSVPKINLPSVPKTHGSKTKNVRQIKEIRSYIEALIKRVENLDKKFKEIQSKTAGFLDTLLDSKAIDANIKKLSEQMSSEDEYVNERRRLLNIIEKHIQTIRQLKNPTGGKSRRRRKSHRRKSHRRKTLRFHL